MFPRCGKCFLCYCCCFPWLFVWPVPGMWADGSIICVLSGGSLVSGCSPFPWFLGEMLSDFCLV